MNLFSSPEESVPSFLRGSSSATIDSLGSNVKPEPPLVSAAEGSSPFNTSKNYRESNALPFRGALYIALNRILLCLGLPIPLPRITCIHSRGCPVCGITYPRSRVHSMVGQRNISHPDPFVKIPFFHPCSHHSSSFRRTAVTITRRDSHATLAFISR